MIAVGIRLFWNSVTYRWTLVEDVADASGCETTVIAEHFEQCLIQRHTPLAWAAQAVGCKAADFRPVYDNTHRLPTCWAVPVRALQSA